MLTFFTTPTRDMSLSVINAVERHSITTVTVKTVGPRFCDVRAGSAMVVVVSTEMSIGLAVDQSRSRVAQPVVVTIMFVLLLLLSTDLISNATLHKTTRWYRRGGGGEVEEDD